MDFWRQDIRRDEGRDSTRKEIKDKGVYLGVQMKLNDDNTKFILFLCVVTICFFLLMDNSPANKPEKPEGPISYLDPPCSSLDLIETASCLQGFLEPWYNYNISNARKDLTLEQLKEQGGVCWHYAKWYQENLESLGFSVKNINFNGTDVGHVFTIVWTPELGDGNGAYCVIDQLAVSCYNLGEVDMDYLNSLENERNIYKVQDNYYFNN